MFNLSTHLLADLAQIALAGVAVLSLFVSIIVASISLWLSRFALSRSDWNSQMATSPSIVLRAWGYVSADSDIDKQLHADDLNLNYNTQNDKDKMLTYYLCFEGLNHGRGIAFNIQKPTIHGAILSKDISGIDELPSYQTLTGPPIKFRAEVTKQFEDWLNDYKKEITVKIILRYTNDQNNVACQSIWEGSLQPFFKTFEGELAPNDSGSILTSKVQVHYKPLN